jgi:hypothetical protein
MKLTTLVLTAAGLAVANAQFGCHVEKVICCVNNYRAKYGLKPLNMDTTICRACQKHSQDMASRHTLDHNGSGGSDAGDRMRSAGVKVGAWAENIASGQKTEEAVCAAWIKSPGHRRNIVGSYDAVCVARYGDYWTQDFAKYTGYGNATPVRCSGSAPVASAPSAPTATAPSSGKTLTYRKVVYRKLFRSNGRLFYKYYYKLVPVYTRTYHSAEGDYNAVDAVKPDSYDTSDVKDVAEDYEPTEPYQTDDVEYTATEPTAEEPVYKPKCSAVEPAANYS